MSGSGMQFNLTTPVSGTGLAVARPMTVERDATNRAVVANLGAIEYPGTTFVRDIPIFAPIWISNKRGGGVQDPDQFSVLCTEQVNLLMYNAQIEHYLNANRRTPVNGQTPFINTDIENTWKYFGVAGTGITQGEYTRIKDLPGRLIKAVVESGTHIVNYWGDVVSGGTHLFFVLKYVPIGALQDELVFTPSIGRGIPRKTHAIAGRRFMYVPQWFAVCHSTPQLPFSKMTFTVNRERPTQIGGNVLEEFEESYLARYIYVGQVIRNPEFKLAGLKTVDSTDQEKAVRDIRETASKARLDVLLA